MADHKHDQVQAFDLLSQAARQRLRARIADAGGDTAQVAREIGAQLERLDMQPAPAGEGASIKRQAERAFLVAQLTYLTHLAQQADQPDQPRERRGLGRIWNVFKRQHAPE